MKFSPIFPALAALACALAGCAAPAHDAAAIPSTPQAAAPAPQAAAPTPLSAAPAPQAATPESVSRLLAEHETQATFEGAAFRRCLGRTALCPERCGGSGEFARFTIDTYTRYASHSPESEPQKTFAVRLTDFYKNPVAAPEIVARVRALKKGDKVRLCWQQIWVTKDGVSEPTDSVVALEKLP